MSEIREKAFGKMTKEMLEEHSRTEEILHDWLCQQNDDDIFNGVLKQDRTIKGAMKYCFNKAKNLNHSGNAAMVASETVFSWVKEYFVFNEKMHEEKREKDADIPAILRVPSENEERKNEDEQLDLFDSLWR